MTAETGTGARPFTGKPDPGTQAEHAATDLLRRIETLELPPGATFTERELADLLGMSKAPVREGLLRLAGTGLLTPRTGSGYTIMPITLRSARDLFETWAIVEPAAIELGFKRSIPPAWAPHLREWLQNTHDVSHGDSAAVEQAFHFGLCTLSQNGTFMQLFPMYQVPRVLRLAARLGHEATCPGGAHDELVDAIERNDPEAPAISRRNVESLQQQVIDAMINAEKLQGINLGAP